MLLLEKGGFDGMAMEASRRCLYRGGQLAAGVKIYPLGSRNEGICECSEKLQDYGGKVLEYTRESTAREAAASGAGRSEGGTGRSHFVPSHGDFSHDGY